MQSQNMALPSLPPEQQFMLPAMAKYLQEPSGEQTDEDRGRSITPTLSQRSVETEEEHGEGMAPASPNPYSFYYTYKPEHVRNEIERLEDSQQQHESLIRRRAITSPPTSDAMAHQVSQGGSSVGQNTSPNMANKRRRGNAQVDGDDGGGPKANSAVKVNQGSIAVRDITLLKVECFVCMMDDLPANKTTKLGCGHRMCHSCLKRQFSLSVSDLQHMPPTCCTAEHIPFKYVDSLVDDKFKRLWNKKYQEYTTANRLYCPAKGCGEWITPTKIRMDVTYGRKYARCHRCNTKVCVLCKSKFHTRRECPKDEETNRLVQTAKDQG